MKHTIFLKLTQNGTSTLMNVDNISCIYAVGEFTRIRFIEDWLTVDQDFNTVQALLAGSGVELYEPPILKNEQAIMPTKQE